MATITAYTQGQADALFPTKDVLGVGVKRGAYMVSAAGGNTNSSIGVGSNGASIRNTMRLPVTTTRWRLRLANKNMRDDLATAGAFDFTGMWAARYGNVATGWGGAFGPTPTQYLDAWSVPDLGAGYTSPWITDPTRQFTANIGYQLALGYVGAAGVSVVRGYAGTFYTSDKAHASQVAPAVTAAEVSVFDWWIEYESLTDAPAIVWFGDSLSVGRRGAGDAGLGSMSAAAPAYGVRTRSLVLNNSFSGSTLSTFSDTTKERMTRFGTAQGFAWDAAIVALGTNNIENGDDVATIKTAYGNTLNAIRTLYAPSRIYVCTIPARVYTGDDTAKHVVRNEINTWLETLPFGVQGCFRLDQAVKNPAGGNTLDPAVVIADNTHMNTIGSQRMSLVLPGRI